MINHNKHIHILGPGAMGLFWGTHLAEQSWNVTLIHKKLSEEQFQVPIILERDDKITQYSVSHTTASKLNSKMKLLLVSVKAPQLIQAFKPLITKLSSNTLIILMQNGAGAAEKLLHKFPILKRNRLIQAVTTHGALRIEPFRVRQTGQGYCWFGFSPAFQSNNKKPRQLPSTLKPLFKLNLINGWKINISQLIWQKLIINASINPLTAILNCKNGELLNKGNLTLMTEVVNECCAIANSTGLTILPSEMLIQVKLVCKQTSENYSSMLQDVLKGNRTEIDYINQYLIDLAEKHKLESPWNNCLTYIIKTVNYARIRKG